MRGVWDWILNQPEITFNLVRDSSGTFRAAMTPSHGLYVVDERPGQAVPHVFRQVTANGTVSFSAQHLAPAHDLGVELAPRIAARIYRFPSERFAKGTSAFGTSTTLQPNAANLAEVLHLLQTSNPDSYAEFITLVREVLPQVHWVSVVPIDNQQLRIDVWSTDKKHKRADLAIPLNESGTGIGQVLSILYVAYHNEESRAILIDEPQSFLHPGAARKLIEVLKRFPRHQYIIATHSAGVITAADAQEFLILGSEEGMTRVAVASTSDKQTMQAFLSMLGTRLSDVFGMDGVIWVEGPTEEKALPLLLKKFRNRSAGTSIVSIRNTGDLVGKDRDKFFDIYNNLSRKTSLLPSRTAFLFDSEDRDQAAKEDISRRAKGKAFFLGRRMFENYLLHTDAIHAVVNQIEGFSESGQVTRSEITEFLQAALRQPETWKPFPVAPNGDLASCQIHGARVLESLFGCLSNHRVKFEKTDHSVRLFEWILENDFAFLAELTDLMRQILQEAPPGVAELGP